MNKATLAELIEIADQKRLRAANDALAEDPELGGGYLTREAVDAYTLHRDGKATPYPAELAGLLATTQINNNWKRYM